MQWGRFLLKITQTEIYSSRNYSLAKNVFNSHLSPTEGVTSSLPCAQHSEVSSLSISRHCRALCCGTVSPTAESYSWERTQRESSYGGEVIFK